MPSVIELDHASKRFGHIEAVKDVSFTVGQGEVVAMLGPNGAGKTTTISLLLGLRTPTAGRVRLFGAKPTDRRARSRCGVMLQESGVPDTLTVRELVDLFAAYYPRPMPIDQAIALAGLAPQSKQQAGKLSGGQRQRLYFALAVCGDPDVIFFDEPTVGMDVESRRVFMSAIRDFAARGKTIVLTTHYLEEADQLAERIIVIDRGRIVADASPREIKSRIVGKRMTFSSTSNLRDEDFAGLPVTNLSIDRHAVSLFSNSPETVLRDLFRRNLDVTDLQVVGADLEEAFLSITHDAEGEAAAS